MAVEVRMVVEGVQARQSRWVCSGQSRLVGHWLGSHGVARTSGFGTFIRGSQGNVWLVEGVQARQDG